ncbi:MAG TPA: hypothetical protein DCS87_08850 [Rheinheimera sp.]|nr:hypothetical protein [Rheinheimera sp.]
MFKTLTAPAARLSRQLTFRRKFLIIFFASVLPGLGLLMHAMSVSWQEIQRDEYEIVGNNYIEAMAPVLEQLHDHRKLTAQWLSGDINAATKLNTLNIEINSQLQQLRQRAIPLNDVQWPEKLDKIASDFEQITNLKPDADPVKSMVAHINLAMQVDEFRHHVAGDTGLLLDPDARSYYLIITTLDTIPSIDEHLQQVIAILTQLQIRQTIDPKRIARVDSVMEREIPRLLARIENDIELSADVDAATAAKLQELWDPTAKAILQLQATMQQMLFVENPKISDLANVLLQAEQISSQFESVRHFGTTQLDKVLHERIAQAKANLWWFSISGLLILSIVAWLIGGFASDMTYRTSKVKGQMQRLAEGNFAQGELELAGNDEISDVAQSGNVLASELGTLLHNIQHGALQLIDAANSIAATSQQLASSSHEQSSAATAMAAAMEELTVSISQMSHNAAQAEQQTHSSGEISHQSTTVIHNTVNSMQQIAKQVEQASDSVTKLGTNAQAISGIVATIRGIAEQTNLLALNAAIEAARAGESGRGFAVVADEVRSLAARTATSTHEISAVIQTIQQDTQLVVQQMQLGMHQVEQGVQEASKAGSAIDSISTSATQIEQMVHAISDTLKDQSAASQEVAHKVETIAQMAQLNSDATDSSAATAVQLQQLAAQLQKLVSRFHF